MMDKIVNGVNVGASPSYPADGLCPTCRMPFSGVEVSHAIITENIGPDGMVRRMPVSAPPDGPYFTPCHHDARSCFPKAEVCAR